MVVTQKTLGRVLRGAALAACFFANQGCSSEVTQETMPAEQPPEITEANNAMEGFMKSGGETPK